jgi:hypothetical protein
MDVSRPLLSALFLITSIARRCAYHFARFYPAANVIFCTLLNTWTYVHVTSTVLAMQPGTSTSTLKGDNKPAKLFRNYLTSAAYAGVGPAAFTKEKSLPALEGGLVNGR